MEPCRRFPFFTVGLILLTRLALNLNQENVSNFVGLPDTHYNSQKISTFVTEPESLPSDQAYFFVWIRSSKHRLLKHVPLSFTIKSHQMTLLLISGLHPNPGPRRPRYPCGVCSYACKTGVIACDECDQWLHKECVGMSTTLFTRLGDSSDPWICPQCKKVNTSSKSYSLPSNHDTLGKRKSESKSPQINLSPQSQQTRSTISTPPSSTQSSTIPGTSSSSKSTSISSIQSIDTEVHHLDIRDLPQHTSSPKTLSHTRSKTQAKDSLRILAINFRSLRKKGQQLEAVIDDYDPDIILGNETWLDSKNHSSEILPPYLGYEINRRDSDTGPYNGVLIASKKDLQITDINCAENVELISGTVSLSQRKKLFIASYYRPPRCTDSEYNDQAIYEFRKLKMKAKGNT